MKVERNQNMTGNIFTNTLKHFNLVTRHRWVVFKLCCKAGIPWRGLVHDLSKFSPTEFWESVKYYNGSMSPILLQRENKAIRKRGYTIKEEINIIQNIGMTQCLEIQCQ